MRVGLTYDLRTEYLAAGYGEEETAEFDRPETIEAIQSALRELGHQTDRIGNARQLIGRLAAGDRWDLVFNIAEGLRGVAREAQVPAILDVYEIPYTFSDPLVLALALDKSLTKLVVRAAGVPTPDFALIREPEDLASVSLSFPVFAKPVAEGTGKGITAASKIFDRVSLKRICADLLDRFREPVLVETFLPGREFTVGLAGTGREAVALGTMEVLLRQGAEAEVYSYNNKENSEELVDYAHPRPVDDPVVAEAERIALAAWRAMNCRDAGRIDLRCDAAGRPQFLEVNPLAGLHPTHSDLPMICAARGIGYVELLDRIVRSAMKRMRGGKE
jgi:D-alanine-D-alanine ligase